MPPFRTVAGGRAGPGALGILVPPGARTVVVLRPRSLMVDLLVVRRANGSTAFLETNRQAAGLEAQKLGKALINAAETSLGRVDAVAATDANGWWVRAELDDFELLACARKPGQAYRPLVFTVETEAQRIADSLRAVICPPPDADQELYTNMSQFGVQPASVQQFRGER